MHASRLSVGILAGAALLSLGTALLPPAARAQANSDGQAEYENQCGGCHQPGGEGTPGFSPRLAGSAVVTGEPKALIAVVLHGKGTAMPPISPDTSDADVAAILNYTRTAWGNKAGAITAAEIAAARAEKP